MFNTIIKCFLFHPDVDDPVSDNEAKFSSNQLQAKTPNFHINLEHSSSAPTENEIKSSFEEFFENDELAYKSFIVGYYSNVLIEGYPQSFEESKDSSIFSVSMHSDRDSVTFDSSNIFVSYGMNVFDSSLFWSIYPETEYDYVVMAKKIGASNPSTQVDPPIDGDFVYSMDFSDYRNSGYINLGVF